MNVFDYFFICGISKRPAEIHLTGTHTQGNEDIKQIQVSSTLLEHYPQNTPNNPWNIQSTLTQLCHPCGLTVTLNKEFVQASPQFHSIFLTREDGSRNYGHVLTFFETVNDDETKITLSKLMTCEESLPGPIFVEKSICLISQFAYMNISEQVLCQMHEVFTRSGKTPKNATFPVESYIYNLLFEMPSPQHGNSLALIWNPEKPIIIQQPSLLELPFLDMHISSLFTLVGSAQNVLRLLTSAFLEHQILIVSRDCSKLMLVSEAIRSLMFPFQWPHIYAPVLPYKLAHDFVYAPLPYIMGIPMASEEVRFRLMSKFDQCIIDVDRLVLECPEDQPNFPNQITLVQQLSKVYSQFQKKMNEISRNRAVDLSEEMEREEEVFTQPVMQRRNAQKRQSKVFLEESTGMENESNSQETKPKDELIYDATEELKNLHAVSISPAKNSEALSQLSELKKVKADEKEVEEQLFNIKVREIILGSLVSLFSQYDKFVIHPECNENSTPDQWFLNRETQQNFDKASFLSDQAESHLHFLSAFLETQAFASLIDNRITSQLGLSNKDPYLRLFDERIKQAKNMPRPDRGGGSDSSASKEPPGPDFLSRSLSIISAGQSAKRSIDTWIKRSETALRRRFSSLNGRYPRLRKLKNEQGRLESEGLCEVFPNISSPELLQKREKQVEVNVLQCTSTQDPDMKWHQIQETKKNLMRQLSTSEFSPDLVAQTNWKFLAKLLKDVKLKTKKLLVRKLGQEAIELGHTESSIMGLEENTLIGSLCDLLERIWGHGLHASHKKGKSALWSHLLMYEEDERRIQRIPKHEILKTAEGSQLVSLSHHQSMPSIVPQPPRLSPQLVRRNVDDSFLDRRYSQPVIASEGRYILPVPNDLLSNIKRIQQLKEVQTDVGKCRAWIRLSLERKQLQVHLKTLLSNRPLLQTLYKKFSLLRCDDEREQFLYHLLSLNAVDFSCFTNSFTKTMIPYHVWIFPKKQLSGISQTSANVHIIVSGELACTSKISVPKGCLDFSFHHQNLGVLTTLILGHDNAGLLPKWLVDFVLIRNEITGQAFYLPCGRWLGRNVDDGSTQRLLLAEAVPLMTDLNQLIHDITTGRGKFGGFALIQKPNTIQELQDRVGQAVNAIVKHFHRSAQERTSPGALTPLLCSPSGLIPALMQVFQHGLKSAGFFRKQIFAWDVITAACQVLSGKSPAMKQEPSLYRSTLSNLGDMLRNASPQRTANTVDKAGMASSSGRSSPQQTGRDDEGLISSSESVDEVGVLNRLLKFHSLISGAQEVCGLGKDDMFQLIVCVGLKEHCLSNWLRSISKVIAEGTQLYERTAFMCNFNAISFTIRVLDNLGDYKINFEQIIMRGVETEIQE